MKVNFEYTRDEYKKYLLRNRLTNNIVLFVIGIIIFLFTEFGGEIEATSIGKQSCEKVDNSGYYETSDLEYDEEGYVRCTDNKCQIFYKGNTYDYVCEVEEEYYE